VSQLALVVEMQGRLDLLLLLPQDQQHKHLLDQQHKHLLDQQHKHLPLTLKYLQLQQQPLLQLHQDLLFPLRQMNFAK
jgi:hypothetical protein